MIAASIGGRKGTKAAGKGTTAEIAEIIEGRKGTTCHTRAVRKGTATEGKGTSATRNGTTATRDRVATTAGYGVT